MAGAFFIMSPYQNFVAQKSLLKRLYGEESMKEKQNDDNGDKEYFKRQSTSFSENRMTYNEILREKIEKRKDFNASYCIYTMITFFKSLCCCFAKCCST